MSQFCIYIGGRPCPGRVLVLAVLEQALGCQVWGMLQIRSNRANVSLLCGFAGAHLNAAITLTHCIFGNLPWRKLPAYLLGQFLGSFLGAATVFGLYYGMVMSVSQELLWVRFQSQLTVHQKCFLSQHPV